MAATTKVPLGAETLNRKYYLDVDTTPESSETWVGVFGITNLKPNFAGSMQDTSDFDSDGWQSSSKTAEQWSLEITVMRKTTAADATAYDAGQEWLRSHSVGKFGALNHVHIRWYEMTPDGPREEAYEGTASVQWSPDGGAMESVDTVTVTLTGQGALTEITHPDA